MGPPVTAFRGRLERGGQVKQGFMRRLGGVARHTPGTVRLQKHFSTPVSAPHRPAQSQLHLPLPPPPLPTPSPPSPPTATRTPALTTNREPSPPLLSLQALTPCLPSPSQVPPPSSSPPPFSFSGLSCPLPSPPHLSLPVAPSVLCLAAPQLHPITLRLFPAQVPSPFCPVDPAPP